MKKTKSLYFLIIIICTIIMLVSSVYALVIAFSSVNEGMTIDSVTVNASHEYTSSSASFDIELDRYDLEFNEKADTEDISVKIINSSNVVLNRYYTIKSKEGVETISIANAVLVYLNGEYLDTLSSILSDVNYKIRVDDSYIFNGSTIIDTFTFELHQSAIDSFLDNKSISLLLNTYTDTTNYANNIYVSTISELEKAIDDVNTGLIENPQIILGQSITLTEQEYEVINPFTLVLNSFNLSGGEFVLNDTDAYIEIKGDSTFSSTITKKSYSVDKVQDLISKQIIKETKKVKAPTEIDILGNYVVYTKDDSSKVSSSLGTITSAKLSIGTNSYNNTGEITVKLGDNERKTSFKVEGSNDRLIEDTLKHIPNEQSKDVTTDLFLPTSIPNQNSIITWTSSNTDVMDNEGHIIIDYANSEEITLYAKIQINNSVYLKSFTFKVSVHNDEINFYKLVSEISPLVIHNIYNGENEDYALYYLPIVTTGTSFGNFDYRTTYSTPTNEPYYNWYEHKDIGLKSIVYSMTELQQQKYDYISIVDNNGIGLNRSTLNTYACITITGEYEGKSYSSEINISIAVGSNTQLLEEAFTSLGEEIENIDVLKNIIETRKNNGLHLELGDFYLSAVYNEDYEFSYTIPESSSSIITSISKGESDTEYLVKLNPVNFNSTVTNVSIIATVSYGSIVSERTFYFSVPAALHTSDLGTVSIFNSVQYQVFQSLPLEEQVGTTGFTISNSTLTNTNYDYILLRDIVGDLEYSSNYENNYLTKLKLTEEKYAQGVKDLYFYTNNQTDTNSTDYHAYEFMRLIQWATMNNENKIEASTIVRDSNSLGVYASNYSNGKDFITDDEMNVIMSYYMYYTRCDSNYWDTVYNQSFDRAPGYIYDNQKLLNVIFQILNSTITGNNWYNGSSDTSFGTIYGKYAEIINRYATSITDKSEYAPCQEVYNTRYAWVESSESLVGQSIKYTYASGTASANILYSVKIHSGKYWNCFTHTYSAGSDGTRASIYAIEAYQRDHTMYITEAELTILKIFWLNAAMANNQATQSAISNYEDKPLSTSLITNDILSGYIGYETSDFDTVAEAILNGFDACLIIPTYFTNDGVSKLVNSFYDNYNILGYSLNEVGSSNTFDSKIVSAYIAGNLDALKDPINIKVPYVTNLDTLKGSLSYFSKLENLYVYGNDILYPFLGETELNIFITRTGNNNFDIKTLALEYILVPSNTFNLSYLNNFQNLEYVDLSNNMAIVSTNELVNTKRSNYVFVDISYINMYYEYMEFAIDNIANENTTVYFSKGENLYSTNVGDSSILSNLKDFDSFITDMLPLSNYVYEDEKNRIIWRIEKGNPIESGNSNGCFVYGGKYPECNNPDDMIRIISPYYYCDSTQTYKFNDVTFTFTEGHIYELYFDNSGLIGCKELSEDIYYYIIESTDDLPTHVDDDTCSHIPISTTLNIEDISLISSTSTEQTYTLCNSSTTKNATCNFNTFYIERNNRYITCTSSSSYLSSTYNLSNSCYFSFLSVEDAKKVSDLCKIDNTTLGETTIDTTGYKIAYYIYFPETRKFVVSSAGNINNNVSVCDNYSDAFPFYVYMDNNGKYRLYSTDNEACKNNSISYSSEKNDLLGIQINKSGSVIKYYVSDKNSNSKFTSLTNNTSTISKLITINPHFILSGGIYSNTYIEANEFGYIVSTKVDTYSGYYYSDPSYYCANSYYYLIGDCIYNYSYKSYYFENGKKKDITRTITTNTIKFYYLDSSGNKIFLDKITDEVKVHYWYISSDSVETSYDDYFVKEKGIISVTTSDVFSNEKSLVDTWILDENNTKLLPYISHIKTISQTLFDSEMIIRNVNSQISNYIVNYSGSSYENYPYYMKDINPLTISLSQNANYKVNIDSTNASISFTKTADFVNTVSNDMDSILLNAQKNFGVANNYPLYYGKLYAYNGETMYSQNGYIYKTGYIYRIMPNEDNSNFTWLEYSTFTMDTSTNILINIGSNQCTIGDIFYSTKEAFGHFKPGWYRLVLDGNTNTYNLVKYNDLSITYTDSNYVRILNSKITTKTDDYLGYAGLYDIEISAVLRIKNSDGSYTEKIKRYKLKLLGYRK